MSYNDKLVKLLPGIFHDIDFSKMNDNQWCLIDDTDTMFIRFQGNIAQNSFSEYFKKIFGEIEIK